MDGLITNAIREIRNSKKRVSSDAIFWKIKQYDSEISKDDCNKDFTELKQKRIIINKKANLININDSFKYEENCLQRIEDRRIEEVMNITEDLVGVDKEYLGKELNNSLNSQLTFLKEEINRKKHVIAKISR